MVMNLICMFRGYTYKSLHFPGAKNWYTLRPQYLQSSVRYGMTLVSAKFQQWSLSVILRLCATYVAAARVNICNKWYTYIITKWTTEKYHTFTFTYRDHGLTFKFHQDSLHLSFPLNVSDTFDGWWSPYDAVGNRLLQLRINSLAPRG